MNKSGIWSDAKAIADAMPKDKPEIILAAYATAKTQPNFDLQTFANEHFEFQKAGESGFKSDTSKSPQEHIKTLWEVLQRKADEPKEGSSLIPLQHPYIVPGGRFNEIYYWDSYFTMLGLQVSNRTDLIEGMVKNFSYLIDTVGFIPNGTRNYYLTRSQPPFYSLMVDAVSRKDSTRLLNYLPALEREYSFWMAGSDEISEQMPVKRHLLRINDSIVLNRYFDSGTTPRPEAYKEDSHLAADRTTQDGKVDVYVNLRAGAASGWDFSSRWYEEEGDFSSTATARIAAVDLNCLLYFMEGLLSRTYGMAGDSTKQQMYSDLAVNRAKKIQQVFWDTEAGFYMDYNYKLGQLSDEFTLAGVYPLFFNIATEEQAQQVKERIMTDFLKDGGLLTTLKDSGQQWDAPLRKQALR